VGLDVEGVDLHVKVVDQIRHCVGPRPYAGYQGCAYPNDFRSFIVVHPSRHLNQGYPAHLLWAHEFGHLTGLQHRDGPLALMTRCPLKVMFSKVPDNRVQVTRDECRCLMSGPGACPLPEAPPGIPVCR
jgi:hypothetical protein